MCNSITQKLSSGLVDQHSGNLFPVMDAIGDSIEDVGGTLGAIIAIFVASFTSSLRTHYAKSAFEMDVHAAAQAASEALKNLCTYTGARVGGRTVMDSLIPFVETLEQSKDLDIAVAAAEQGAKKTEGMSAKFGRASYLGEDRKKDQANIPMDPGAWAAAVFTKGLNDGLRATY